MTNSNLPKKALFQKLPLTKGNSFLVKRYTSPFFETPWHFHEEYELVYCETGFGKKFIGNSFTNYNSGELYLLGKNLPHWFKADDTFYDDQVSEKPSSIVIQFLEDFMGKSFFKSIEMQAMARVLQKSQNGLEIKGEANEAIKHLMLLMLEADPIKRLELLIQVFGVLSLSKELQHLSTQNVLGINVNDSSKMNTVLDFSLNNFKNEIRIEEVAGLVNLSSAAFCRYFKSRTQKTYMSFIIDLRLDEAKKLLSQSEKSVLEICYETGFKNLSNFNRAFRKRMELSPSEFRKQN